MNSVVASTLAMVSDVRFSWEAVQPGVLIWPLIFGTGLYLLLTAQPVGRPRRALADYFRRMDVDERIRDQLERRDTGTPFSSRSVLGRLLAPAREDAGAFLQKWLQRVGLDGGRSLERKLQLTGSKSTATQFWGEKLLTGVVALAFFPTLDALGLELWGSWPVWLWVVAFIGGFMAPDWQLERRMADRRTRLLAELPSILDLLTIAASAGLGLEQALKEVSRRSAGLIGEELLLVSSEMEVNRRTLIEALDRLAERNAVPELTTLVGQLRAVHEHGIPLVQALTTQVDALRERQRVQIVEAGGRALAKLIVPVVIFIFPVFFVVILGPAVMSLMNLI